ncbi:MAG: LPS export ABC transporter periplasmic protein LptC [Bacteroidales bacterium]|jgi:LPS export ABC transporter protein LptC|nr:LPS export ABC transporter periplasmic protein LptC [Bacteroidales bacterium]MCK9447787.1 LPS export ABC transporter periplasmic protein LptC [Bacteroidales bacterium]MDD3700106.1 LPS export ABC transporter periplasmic protein LptC [Bacteroidales bacterium]MDY0369070.1 LPS export ABC transporter periplasmic protein LptC [Bacteroidales bacterium]
MNWIRFISRAIKSHIILFFLAALIWASCENPMSVVRELSKEDTLATVSASNITYIRSDSGEVMMILTAPLMLQYDEADQIIEFPQGFMAQFLDSLQQPNSQIQANYGISYDKIKLMIAKGEVEVENFHTKEVLQTDTLYWDQKSKEIFSRSTVKITGPEKVIFGDSLVAAEDFSSRTIYNIRATLEIDEEDQ